VVMALPLVLPRSCAIQQAREQRECQRESAVHGDRKTADRDARRCGKTRVPGEDFPPVGEPICAPDLACANHVEEARVLPRLGVETALPRRQRLPCVCSPPSGRL
jgi:hypothetical protein